MLQTNKKFSHLKQKQKEWINQLLKEKYIAVYTANQKKPSKSQREIILNDVYKILEDKSIWIPLEEVERYFQSKIHTYQKIYLKQKPIQGNKKY